MSAPVDSVSIFTDQITAAARQSRDDDAAELLRLLHDVDADAAAVVAAQCYGDSTDWIW